MRKLIIGLPLSILILCTFATSIFANPNNGTGNQSDDEQCTIKVGFEYSVDNLTVEFRNTSAGNWDNLVWEFGDGETSNLSKTTKKGNVAHTYTTGGMYTFCLTATNNKTQCDKQFCGQLYVFD